jgi:ribosomal subunit interface protein
MSEHVIFREVAEATKPLIEDYWGKKLPRLQKLLASYNSDLQEIDLTIYQHPQNSHRHWYEARAVVHLPNGALAAQAEENEANAAIDRVADVLVTEIKKHQDRLRNGAQTKE